MSLCMAKRFFKIFLYNANNPVKYVKGLMQLIRVAVLAAVVLLVGGEVWGQTNFTWTGAINNNWNNAGNWTKIGTSTSTWPGQNNGQNDFVIINNGTPNINANFNNTSVKDVTINGGTLTTANADYTNVINGNLVVANGATFNLRRSTLNVVGTTTINGSVVDLHNNGPVTFTGH